MNVLAYGMAVFTGQVFALTGLNTLTELDEMIK